MEFEWGEGVKEKQLSNNIISRFLGSLDAKLNMLLMFGGRGGGGA